MKYIHGQRIAEILHDGEPFFLIRAQDALSTPAILGYAVAAKAHGLDVVSQQVAAVAVEFAEWQQANPSLLKLPD